MTRRAVLILVAVLFAAACSSSGDGAGPSAEASTPSPTATAVVGDDVSPEFCDGANGFVTDSRVRFITSPDAAVFATIDEQLADLVDLAPASVNDDVAALRSGFAAIGDAYAAAGYEPSASFVLPVEVQDANLIASRNLENVLLESCELEAVRDEQIAQISEAFGIEDPSLSECLHAQMGDIANIDSSTLTPELMTTTVCDTSILGLLSGTTSDS